MSGPPRAVVAPMTPLLFREAGGRADPVAELRETLVDAVRELAAVSERVVALCPVGGPGAPASYHRGGAAAPLSVLVARHLLDLAGATGALETVLVTSPTSATPPIAPITSTAPAVPAGAGLLVLGDGTARRSATAPGYLDDRCLAFDDDLCRALEGGDGRALARLDQGLAEELMVTGRHTLAALGRTLPRASGEVRWRGDPFGVTYLVAVWS